MAFLRDISVRFDSIWLHLAGDKSFELRMLQEKHRDEVTELKKRLQWYAENQELLDKDAARLRTATAETQRLTEQVSIDAVFRINRGHVLSVDLISC